MQAEHFGDIRTFEQELPPGDQIREQVEFYVVELKEFRIVRPVERRVGEQELGRTTLDDRAQKIRRREVIDGLRGQEHRRIALSPGFQRLFQIGAQAIVLN